MYYCELFGTSSRLLYRDPRPNLVRALDDLISGSVQANRAARVNSILSAWGNFQTLLPEHVCHVCDHYREYVTLSDRYLTNVEISPGALERVQERETLDRLLRNCLEADIRFKALTRYDRYIPEVALRLRPGMLLKIHTEVHGCISGSVNLENLCATLVEERALVRE